LFAVQELVLRYVFPWLARLGDPGQVIDGRSLADVQRTLASIERMAATARRRKAALVVLFVEQPRDVEPVDELTNRAKALLFARLRELGVPWIRPADAIERAGGARLFRDNLHPNADGNRILAQEAARAIRSWFGPTVPAGFQRPSAFEMRTEAGAP
jgi:hypothetical protein